MKKLAILGLSALLAACGGGSGGGSSSVAPQISGVAATGAAFSDATIAVKDRTNATVGTATVATDGTYKVTLSSGAAAPFVLIATRTAANGATESLVSVVPAISGTSATANISPVTNLIASRLAAESGDPLKLAAEVAANPALADPATVTSKVQEVQSILAPLLAATNTAGTDPLTGTFATDGTGYDWLLDSIKVTIVPSSATTTDIQVDIKQPLTDSTPPTSIQFTNQTAVASIPALPATIDATTLVPSGTSALIAQHLAQLNACFALPLSSRVTVNGTTAADIVALECKNAFYNNDPTTFLTNGNPVAKGKAFSGIFDTAADGTVFSQGTYEFSRIDPVNGDIVVIGYKKTDALGNETFDVFGLRKDPADGNLKQIGNQYSYPGGVSAYQQARHFITLGQSAFDYYSTGYTFSVVNVLSTGAPIFNRVEITTPRGNVLTLKPKSGYSNLQLVKNAGTASEVVTATQFVRLNSEYIDTANTADPAAKDPASLYFADRTVFTNDVIAQFPAQTAWKFDYFLAANATTTPDATQYYKTRARALTIPELKTRGLAELLPTAIADIQAQANPTTGQVPVSGATSLAMNYSVATGALPPTALQVWGTYSSGGFTDSVGVGSTARTGTILCTNLGVSDTHCTNATPAAYVSSAIVNGGHLWARDPAGRDFATFYAMYQLLP